jgi:hypothetical protein
MDTPEVERMTPLDQFVVSVEGDIRFSSARQPRGQYRTVASRQLVKEQRARQGAHEQRTKARILAEPGPLKNSEVTKVCG